MTTTVRPTPKPAVAKRVPLTSLRKSSLAAGVMYLLSFVSIPSVWFYGPVKKANYVLGSGPDTQVLVGGILEVIVAFAGIGTAVALYPVIKRQHNGVALGFVGSRILEAATIVSGVVSLLSIVTLRKAGLGTDALATSHALVAQYNNTFLLGQALIPGVNALLLGYLMYRSRLVPRVLPILGLVGAPLLIASVVAKYFGAYDEHSALSGLGALPVAAWEFSLGVYLIVKGFKRCRITADITAAAAPAPRDRNA